MKFFTVASIIIRMIRQRTDVQSEKSVEETVKKLDDLDLDSLNKAIKDLSAIISPLAKLFRK